MVNCTKNYTEWTKALLFTALLLLSITARAWEWWPLPMAQPDTARDSIFYIGSVKALSSSGTESPTLFQSNQDGNISMSPHSGNFSIGIIKPATHPNRWYDYDFGAEITCRLQSNTIFCTGYINQLYAHARLYIVDITAGITPIEAGGNYSELTSGSLLISRNTHPIPHVSVGIDHWTSFPGLYGYLEIRGGMTYGWLGDNNEYVRNVKLHYKYAGARIGGKLPVNFAYEVHHIAQWGGYSPSNLDYGNNWNSFINVFLGRSGGTIRNDQLNAQGNHIISQQLTLTTKWNKWNIDIYWQNISEDGKFKFITNCNNREDGLWGIHISQSQWPFINGLTYEFINTTDQSGPYHDRDGLVFGGNDNYYYNAVYKEGWTYYGRTIGSPILTLDNNRVMAHYVGVKGNIYGYLYKIEALYQDNYGTYKTPARSNNTALCLSVSKHVEKAWGLDFGVRLATDFGSQYGNRFGAQITISKKGFIAQW